MAPIEPPPQVEIPAAPEDAYEAELSGVEEGVPGGNREGMLAGLRAEIPEDAPPRPAPAAPPPVPAPPVRVGGVIRPPALIERVDPVYPAAALAMGLEGRVILEAIVDEEGRVIDVRVVRSADVFDKAALASVRQWRYAPVLIDGRPVKFILTVVVSFTIQR
jgi:protein TonB